jgi:hypothetical protein
MLVTDQMKDTTIAQRDHQQRMARPKVVASGMESETLREGV